MDMANNILSTEAVAIGSINISSIIFYEISLPLGIGSRDAMQLFSTFLSPPLLPMHESRHKFEKMQPRASQVYKIHHKMLHMSK
jgi:hypothetical protein